MFMLQTFHGKQHSVYHPTLYQDNKYKHFVKRSTKKNHCLTEVLNNRLNRVLALAGKYRNKPIKHLFVLSADG